MRSNYYPFQFYNSPIKTIAGRIYQAEIWMFQFYNSPIKTKLRSIKVTWSSKFQFYNSPIKTHPNNIKKISCYASKIFEKSRRSLILQKPQGSDDFL